MNLAYSIKEVIVRNVEVVERPVSYYLVIKSQKIDVLASSLPNSFLIFLGNKVEIIWDCKKLFFWEVLAYLLQNIHNEQRDSISPALPARDRRTAESRRTIIPLLELKR
jgi:hypothetical protein